VREKLSRLKLAPGPAGRAGSGARSRHSNGSATSGSVAVHHETQASWNPRCANHGVLAPNAKLMSHVVPLGPQPQEQASEAAVAKISQPLTSRAGWSRPG